MHAAPSPSVAVASIRFSGGPSSVLLLPPEYSQTPTALTDAALTRRQPGVALPPDAQRREHKSLYMSQPHPHKKD